METIGIFMTIASTRNTTGEGACCYDKNNTENYQKDYHDQFFVRRPV